MKKQKMRRATAICLALGMTFMSMGQAFANEETQTTEATSSVEWIDETEVETELELVTEPVTEPETETSENEIFESEITSTEVSETQEMEETGTETQEVETEETTEEETTEAETEEVIECEENMISEHALYNGGLSPEEQEQAQKELDQIERPENYLVGDFNSQSECVLYLRSQMGLRFNYVEMNLYSSEDWSNSVQQTMVDTILNKAMEYTGVSYEGDAINFDYKAVISFGGQYPLGNGRYRYKIGYKIVYRTNAQQEKELRTAIQNKTAELCNGVSSEYEKIRRIYDFVCSTVSFDYVHKNNSNYGFKFTAYAAMMNHTAVCLGYATLFYRMCLEAGISSRVITSEKIDHAWNIVRIGNAYYNVDSTWDAYDSPINRNYKYFLKSNAEFKGHERDAEFNTASFNAIYPMTQKSYSVPREHQMFIGLYCTNGTWYYYEGGEIKRNFTDLVLYDGTWYYVQKGVLNWKYTGLADHDGVWYYVKNGCIDWSYTGLTRYYGTWYYVQKGILNWSYVGLMQYSGTWYYIVNGCVNWNYTGLTQYYNTWYYVQNGYVNWKYTGLVKYYGTWYYVENGVLNRAYIGLTKYYGTWYYVWKGVLKWSYTGLARYYGTWYYVENGVLNWNYTGLTNFYGTWYYVEKGILNWNYTGFTDYYGTRYYIENGVLNWNYTAHKLEDFLGTYCVNTNLRVTGYPMGNVDVLWLQVNNGVLQRVDRPFRNALYQTEYYRYDSYKIEGDKLICQYSRTYDSFGNVASRRSGTDTYVITDSGDLIKGSDTLYRYDESNLK